MGKNLVKNVYRSLFRRKSYSLINLFGLTLGITCCLLILVYIGYELSYDGYHRNADRIYRIAIRQTQNGRSVESAASPAPVGPTLVQNFPEVAVSVRISPTVKRAFTYQDKKFFQDGVFYADQSIFDVFSFELVEGNPKTALELPFTMVLTQETARRYFGRENPIGKFVQWDNRNDYQVTGVVKDPPPNSHFVFSVLASFSTFIKYDAKIGEWGGGSFPTYVLLRDKMNLPRFDAMLGAFTAKYLEPRFKGRSTKIQVFGQPLKRIHLTSRLQGELGANSDGRIVAVFAAVAGIILIMACVNFMNLTTARSTARAKEVGMRKILGAERRTLIALFLGESTTLALLGLILAVASARLLLPLFNRLAGLNLGPSALLTPSMFAGMAGIVVFVGLAAGSYPAFILSSFPPLSALRGLTPSGSRRSGFRSGLIVFQFAATAFLIVAALVVFRQQKYLKNKDLGFNKKNLLVVALQNDAVRVGLESWKAELRGIPGVVGAGASSMVPGEIYLFNLGVFPEGFPREQPLQMDNFVVDYGFFDTFQAEVIQGRKFSQSIGSDMTDAVMINETAADKLGWPNPVGKTMEIRLPFSGETKKKTVIGVFRDIHQRSLYAPVNPTFVDYIGTQGPVENRARRLSIRLDSNDIRRTMARIEESWNAHFPNHPYYAFFMDEFYDGQHRAEGRLAGIIGAFSMLAMMIGGFGLFGLASYTAERRTREIGIRKTLGSSSAAIVLLLIRKFVGLVLAANVVAWPVAAWTAGLWLRKFPYRVSMVPGDFFWAAFLTIFAAAAAVGILSIKAAHSSPAISLRQE
jgi:putative ABC transport system permease protein